MVWSGITSYSSELLTAYIQAVLPTACCPVTAGRTAGWILLVITWSSGRMFPWASAGETL